MYLPSNAGQTRLKDFPYIKRSESKLDEQRSEPDKGLYICAQGDMSKYNLRDTRSGKRSDWWFHWARNDSKRISILKATKGYDFVTKNDDVVPMGMPADSEGRYVYGDLVLMKRSLESYLVERYRMKLRNDAKLKAITEKFKDTAKAGGVGLPDDIADEIVDGLLTSGKRR